MGSKRFTGRVGDPRVVQFAGADPAGLGAAQIETQYVADVGRSSAAGDEYHFAVAGTDYLAVASGSGGWNYVALTGAA